MRVYIINTEQHQHALRVKRMIEALEPDWHVEIIPHNAAVLLNMRLSQYDEPLFATIPIGGGTELTIELFEQVRTALAELPEDGCGIAVAGRRSGMPEPLVWRTRFALERGPRPFLEAMPFPLYAGRELYGALQAKLGDACRWTEVRASDSRVSGRIQPRWRQAELEASLIEPLLRSVTPQRSGGETPLVTVLLCTYNDGRYVEWAAESVLRQTDARWALVIVDDGSTDGTAAKLQRYADIEGVSLIRMPVNRGKAAALNRAMEEVSTPWLMELDADDWLPADAVARLAAAVGRADTTGAAGEAEAADGADAADAGRTIERCGVLQAGCCEWTALHDGRLVCRGMREAGSAEPHAQLAERIRRGDPIVPRIYRTEAVLQAGGWPTDGPGGGRLYEDFEMLVRLAARTGFGTIPGCLYHRRLRARSMTRTHADRYPEWRRRMQAIRDSTE